MQSLTPKQIVSELDKYIIGQQAAKRAVAVAVRNRWRRQQLDESLRADVMPKNIIMIGPTGVGKTEIARRLAALSGAPFVKIEATKFTEVGYQGRDVDAMIRDLLDAGIAMVRNEMADAVRAPALESANARLVQCLLATELDRGNSSLADREIFVKQNLANGTLESTMVDISTEDRPTAMGLLGNAALEMDVELQSAFERMMPARRQARRLSVREARRLLVAQESEKLLDKDALQREAVERVEQAGIVFLDEIDKICGSDSPNGPDVSRQGVQRDLLPIVEGSTVITKHGPVKTDHILFIAAGAFHTSSPSDLMPELQGRFPIRVELQDLTRDDFVRILKEPHNSLVKQTIALLGTEGLRVRITEDAIDSMADIAFDVNKRTHNIGARRLHTILERVFESLGFDAPDLKNQTMEITAAYVRQQLGDIWRDTGKTGYVL